MKYIAKLFVLFSLKYIFYCKHIVIKLKNGICRYLVDLRTIGIADSPIIVDRSPPIAGKVNDGEIYKMDLEYTMYPDKVYPHLLYLHND